MLEPKPCRSVDGDGPECREPATTAAYVVTDDRDHPEKRGTFCPAHAKAIAEDQGAADVIRCPACGCCTGFPIIAFEDAFNVPLIEGVLASGTGVVLVEGRLLGRVREGPFPGQWLILGPAATDADVEEAMKKFHPEAP